MDQQPLPPAPLIILEQITAVIDHAEVTVVGEVTLSHKQFEEGKHTSTPRAADLG